MNILSRSLPVLCLMLSVLSVARADQAARVVFLAGRPSHGYGAHEHLAGCRILADAIQRSTDNQVRCEVYENGWPDDESVLQGADSIVMYCDGGGGHPALGHLPKLAELMKAGVGFVCLHYAVEVPPDRGGVEFLDWLGGYFETNWSVNPHWIADYTSLPKHEVTRGVKPFRSNDEWYFHMRFRANMEGVTPILSAVPPEDTMRRPDGPHSGNPAVRKAVAEGLPQHTAWVFDRPDGGRSFGFTGGHYHWNWGREEILRLVGNAICWTAKFEIPPEGLPVFGPSLEVLEQGQDYPIPKNHDREKVQQQFDLLSRNIDLRRRDLPMDAPPQRHPSNAVAGLKLSEGLKATLSASEPYLLSPTCLDVDHRGRVWICEVMNYRAHQGKRPEGDRILILEDENGDGIMDTGRVFYQGSDIDSAMGICVLGNRVIVSASPNIWIFTDDDGDDIPERKELLFSQTGQAQHDHSAHSFVFGPDGKLYWNFGNTGKSVHDADGNPVVDLAGNVVTDSGRPYYGGMVFRCNLDGSQFETLAHNFRNNYEVCVDSFGALWQSDNDDDGNRATRINFVMEYGNYGYLDELTGAGWRVPRANLESTVPEQHWHLNDPGVVPTMLITGAGSPSGILIYEGELLPPRFHNQIIHCEPGHGVVRAYPVTRTGAGYSATIENVMQSAGDDWFRPVDVCTAPDGSLFVADWYDPGVGGHHMGDLDRGRLYRLAPDGVDYMIPKLDLSTPERAAQGLLSPNQATRFMAWQALQEFGKDAQGALERFAASENPRVRAKAYWALGKIPGHGRSTVASALSDADADVRCAAIRLARQVGISPSEYFVKVLGDSSPAVRRELAIALRLDQSPEMPGLWAALAAAYDGSDRWYLEALGVGAELRWEECFAAYVQRRAERKQPLHDDIIWRARTSAASKYLTEQLSSRHATVESVQRYLRALDYHSEETRNAVLTAAVQSKLQQTDGVDLSFQVIAELLIRLPDGQVNAQDESIQNILYSVVCSNESRRLRLEILKKYEIRDSINQLLKVLCETRIDDGTVVAAQLLLQRVPAGELGQLLTELPEDEGLRVAEALASVSQPKTTDTLLHLLKDQSLPTSSRLALVKGVARTPKGSKELLSMAEDGSLPRESHYLVGSLLRSNQNESIRTRAVELFPVPRSKSSEIFPAMGDLVGMIGDVQRGSEVYKNSGTCAKCHPLDSSAKSVGPDLSEIGSKLAKEALYVAILDPSAGISHSYETYSALTADGRVINGLLVSRTDSQLILRDAEGIDHSVFPESLEDFRKLDKSLMPENLVEQLTVQELVDLVEYLQTLKK